MSAPDPAYAHAAFTRSAGDATKRYLERRLAEASRYGGRRQEDDEVRYFDPTERVRAGTEARPRQPYSTGSPRLDEVVRSLIARAVRSSNRRRLPGPICRGACG